jgi:arginase
MKQKRDNLSFYETAGAAVPVSIVSVPLDVGSDERGGAQAPQHLYRSGLEKMLAAIGRKISSKPVIHCPKPAIIETTGSMKNANDIVRASKLLAEAVEKARKNGEVAIVLGGNHSVSLGSIAGAASTDRKVGVIWIDAHPDCNTDKTTLTGNIHGMVSASAMGFGNPSLRVGQKAVDPKNFLYVGLKDMDQAEIELIRREKITAFTMLDIVEDGFKSVFKAIDALAKRVDTIWVSLDMDSIDTVYAPGVSMSTEGGFTAREILSLAQYIGVSSTLAGMDIVEMIPAKDKEGVTAKLALELIARFLGGEYNWYRGYMQSYKNAKAPASIITKKKPQKSAVRK